MTSHRFVFCKQLHLLPMFSNILFLVENIIMSAGSFKPMDYWLTKVARKCVKL